MLEDEDEKEDATFRWYPDVEGRVQDHRYAEQIVSQLWAETAVDETRCETAEGFVFEGKEYIAFHVVARGTSVTVCRRMDWTGNGIFEHYLVVVYDKMAAYHSTRRDYPGGPLQPFGYEGVKALYERVRLTVQKPSLMQIIVGALKNGS